MLQIMTDVIGLLHLVSMVAEEPMFRRSSTFAEENGTYPTPDLCGDKLAHANPDCRGDSLPRVVALDRVNPHEQFS